MRPKTEIVGMTLPFRAIDAFRWRYHRVHWFHRAALVGLSLAAAKKAGIEVGDLLELWRSAVAGRQRARTKQTLEKLREVEQMAIGVCGEAVELCVAADFLDSSARCGLIEARQQFLGSQWHAFTTEVK